MLAIEKKDEHTLVLTNASDVAETFLSNFNGQFTHFTIGPSTLSEITIDIENLTWSQRLINYILTLIPTDIQVPVVQSIIEAILKFVLNQIPITAIRTTALVRAKQF